MTTEPETSPPPSQGADVLRRAIVEHRTAITNAGTVRVDARDSAAAEAKHRADRRLWEILDQ